MRRTADFWDRAGAWSLIVWNGLAVAGLAIQFARALPVAAWSFPLIASALSSAATASFLLLQIYFLCVRVAPTAKSGGIAPRLWAFAGAYLGLVILVLPRNEIGALHLAASLMTMAGTLGAIWALAYLGKAYAIFPQARLLATEGPYRLARHPIYLFEGVAVVGLSLGYAQPWGVALALLSFLAEFPRMRFEERVLSENFPAYAAYAAKTAMLVPGVY